MKKSILMLAVMTVFAFTSCKDNAADKVNDVNVAAAADRDANASKFPVMELEKTEHDFGTIAKGEAVEYNFQFKNTGDAPLVIVDAKSSCGCTVPEFTKEPVAPGDTGELLVKYNGSGANQVSKTVTITANTKKGKETLVIKAFVTPAAGDAANGANMLQKQTK
ncbi:DUF1573 domain-containing protein [Cochleicola gelatinilyticus]|uniref:DUF1573 domain-containing protein n=1 Tax=Cochleicola gelatinilyticus TaxID=1763537 RepID=A0A167EN10_9FLAO|nr:DUF1573 domain-containing protein [Cochleicola gelatinilyticus]OAB75701.1 hypothetical protein ULVI_14590 [Cochleicola gelatinilyticus]